MLSLHENKIIVYKRNTLWTHTEKGFGIPAFNDSKKYYSLIKVSIDSETPEIYLGTLNLKPNQTLTPLSKKPIKKSTEKAKQDYLDWKLTIC